MNCFEVHYQVDKYKNVIVVQAEDQARAELKIENYLPKGAIIIKIEEGR